MQDHIRVAEWDKDAPRAKRACRQCGCEILPKPGKTWRPNVFCSEKCKSESKPKKKAKKTKAQKRCEGCGKPFTPKFNSARFCTQICALKNWIHTSKPRKQLATKQCKHCNAEFKTYLRSQKFCTLKCSRSWQSTDDGRRQASQRQYETCACVVCLRKVGFGAKAIARFTRKPLSTIKGQIRRLSIESRIRAAIAVGHRINKNRNKPKVDKVAMAQASAFRSEWPELKIRRLFDATHDCPHWAFHPEIQRGLRRIVQNSHRKRKTNYYISKLIRVRIKKVLEGNNKAGKTTELLGCTWQQFRLHIQSQFRPGMSWKNQGKWHIDHIQPCASFDLTKPEEQRRCFHYTNHRPMWAKANISKGRRVVECQPEFLIPISDSRNVKRHSRMFFYDKDQAQQKLPEFSFGT